MEEILDTVKQYVGMYWKWMLGGVILIILIVFVFIKPSEPKENNTDSMHREIIEQADDMEEREESEAIEQKVSEGTPSEIFVDVKGAVQHPGVYEMPSGARLIDVIEKAGGFTKEADSNTVNLAQLLTDQMMIYVGKLGEEPLELNLSNGEQTQVDEENGENSSININTAESAELMELKGIGEAKAQNIIAYREENGKFETREEIKEVSGIGEGIFEGLKENITVH